MPLGSEALAGSSSRKHACASHVDLILCFISPPPQFGVSMGARGTLSGLGYVGFNVVKRTCPGVSACIRGDQIEINRHKERFCQLLDTDASLAMD